MKYLKLHPWNVEIDRAREIQEELRGRVVLESGSLSVEKVAGVDVGYSGDKIVAAVCVFRSGYPTHALQGVRKLTFSRLKPGVQICNLLDARLGNPCQSTGRGNELNYTGIAHLVEVRTAVARVSFPYVPGLLTFREGPVIIKAFRKIKDKPDLILFDGQGICHPRSMGIATHLGIILDTPSIGCAKSSLCGIYKMPGTKRGSFSYIYDEKTNEKIGVVLCTRTGVKPIFVSPGYKIDLMQSIDLVLKLCPEYRIPEPLRCSHRYAKV